MGNPSNDTSAISILRLALDDVFTDRRFFVRQSMSACEVADYILTLIQQGERDPDILKVSTFEKFLVAQPVRFSSIDPFPTATPPTRKARARLAGRGYPEHGKRIVVFTDKDHSAALTAVPDHRRAAAGQACCDVHGSG